MHLPAAATTMSEKRTIEIETKLAFQEESIAELTKSMLQMEKRLERIEARLERLAEKLEETADDGPEIGPQDDPPPHY